MASQLASTEAQLIADWLTALGGSGDALTKSPAQMLAEIRNTYGGSVSHLTTKVSDLVASIDTAAGGSGNASMESIVKGLAGINAAQGGSGSELTLGFAALLGGVIENAGGGEPAWLEDFRAPSGDLPLVASDLTTGDAWDGEAEVLPSALLGITEGSFTLSASGLAENASLFAQSPLATAVKNYANAPVVLIELTTTDPENQGPQLRAAFTDEDVPFTDFVTLDIFSEPSSQVTISPETTVNLADTYTDYVAVARHVFSPGPNSLRVTCNGRAVETVAEAGAMVWADMLGEFLIGNGHTGEYEFMTKIAVYPTMSNANMALLSAVP